ncbi:MAG TPA: coproporphyrinogen-III oxidase family protein, partial [Vampirovibrionales bacterium]
INRLSLGVQTFEAKLNEKLARGHNVEEALEIIELAKSVGFENLSIDLIYGLPKQTMQDWQNTLKIAFSQNIQHISVYSLAIEEGTPYKAIYKSEAHPLLPQEDALADMYSFLQEEALKKGFRHYEVSNYAKPGYESQHNLNYWQNEAFYGFGVSAHQFVNGKRQANTKNLNEYIQNPIAKTELDCNPEIEELMLKLRTSSGINLEEYKSKFQVDIAENKKEIIAKMQSEGLVQQKGSKLKITNKGFILSTQIISQLL